MNYLQEIADAIHAVVPAEQVPVEDTSILFRIYAVLALAKGTRVTAKDVHDAWAAWKMTADPDHESIQPFEELDSDVQADDEPFVTAIRAVASRLDP